MSSNPMKVCRNAISGCKVGALCFLMVAAFAILAPAMADSGDDELNKYVRILHE